MLTKCFQGPKLTVLCRRQVATEIFFSVAKWKNLVAKKWFVKFLLLSETRKHKFLKRSGQTRMYKGIKLLCSSHSPLSLKTEHDATSFSHTSAKPSRSHARTRSGHIARSRPLPNKTVRTSLPTYVIFVRRKHSDYSTRITTVVKVFKLFSMEIENFDKTRVKFLVEMKCEIFRFNSLSGHDAKS